MNKILPAFMCFIAFSAFSQIRFEPGYYIDNQNTKVNGFIKNHDWNQNPDVIEFRSDENSDTRMIPIDQMREFSVGNTVFVKFTTSVDRSPTDIANLSDSKNPQWEKATAMLKVLVKSDLTLYEYTQGNTTRFFVSSPPHSTAEQLIFKEYRKDAATIGQNSAFRQQLSVLMASKNFPVSTFERLSYNERDLSELFIKYAGHEQKTTDKNAKGTNGGLNLKIVAGVNFSKLDFKYRYFTTTEGEFEQKAVPVIGVEAEYMFAFNKNKWSVFLAPNFQSYEGKYETPDASATATYKFVEIPVGIRHHFYLTPKSRLFLNLGYAFGSLLSDSGIAYKTGSGTLNVEFRRTSSVFVGAGFAMNRFGIELRYNSKRELINDPYWSGDYSSYGLQLTYKIL
ncbi:hypothetical protein HUK80_09615 [Flavobacterium sp. MAH-1]|uniref:Outer membrane protein beta-barrel domain-containing protein n=1 Tax=Flavobacterium agri TaxID=2743471 RepID=A0A7Y8Y221_9FLAO|nr:hypothetical protein [Flavobacterium agri]NUY81150.1 hypothetical protein [Flavobacterium agri]NYA71174.1 hypothetical protein [Flavobacterium agri]